MKEKQRRSFVVIGASIGLVIFFAVLAGFLILIYSFRNDMRCMDEAHASGYGSCEAWELAGKPKLT